ncbi:MAG TPA: nitrous oxide-stimulated promoter family protein [Deltaproteobacteria bacterium]|nr:nitrous oxide-stimulated promoter family protein [Deltaproteobacteria bacterium]
MNTQHRTVDAMIRIYCRGKHEQASGLCPACTELLAYALERLERCPFRKNKPRCSRCPVHCYKPVMRSRIKDVMRYAGPRMLYRHPFLAVAHYFSG